MADEDPVIFRDQLRKFGTYGAVSVAVVGTGQATLTFFVGVMHWRAVSAAVASAAIGTVLAYYLYRRFVWKSLGAADLRRTIAIFLGLNLIGLAISAVVVHAAESAVADLTPDGVLRTLAINAASILSYAGIWVLRFVILDRLARPKVNIEPGFSTMPASS